MDIGRVDRGLFVAWRAASAAPARRCDYQSVKSQASRRTLTGVPVLPLRDVLLLIPGPYAGCAPRLAAARATQ